MHLCSFFSGSFFSFEDAHTFHLHICTQLVYKRVNLSVWLYQQMVFGVTWWHRSAQAETGCSYPNIVFWVYVKVLVKESLGWLVFFFQTSCCHTASHAPLHLNRSSFIHLKPSASSRVCCFHQQRGTAAPSLWMQLWTLGKTSFSLSAYSSP